MSNEIQWPSHTIQTFYQHCIIGGFCNQILEMMKEAYDTFIGGIYRSSVIIAGETLQRLNCSLIVSFAFLTGNINHKKIEKLDFVQNGDIKSTDKLTNKLKIYESIKILNDLYLIDDILFLDMNAFRYLRNKMTHSRPPVVYPFNETLDELGITVKDVVRISEGLTPLQWRKQ